MQPDGMPEGRRIEATFADRERADRAVAEARASGLDVVVGDETDERAVLRAEMRDEVESTVMGAGNVGPFTKGMTKGIVRWVPVAAAIGAVFGALIGLIPWGFGMSTLGRVLMGVAIGAVAGATAGFVGGGAFQPQEHDSPTLDAERGITVAVPVSSDEEGRRARDVFGAAEPLRIDETDQGGAPVRPSSEDATRPVRGD